MFLTFLYAFKVVGCDYSIIPRMLSSTVHALEQLKTTDGINLKGIQSFLEQIEKSGIENKKPTHLGDEYFKKVIKSI